MENWSDAAIDEILDAYLPRHEEEIPNLDFDISFLDNTYPTLVEAIDLHSIDYIPPVLRDSTKLPYVFMDCIDDSFAVSSTVIVVDDNAKELLSSFTLPEESPKRVTTNDNDLGLVEHYPDIEIDLDSGYVTTSEGTTSAEIVDAGKTFSVEDPQSVFCKLPSNDPVNLPYIYKDDVDKPFTVSTPVIEEIVSVSDVCHDSMEFPYMFMDYTDNSFTVPSTVICMEDNANELLSSEKSPKRVSKSNPSRRVVKAKATTNGGVSKSNPSRRVVKAKATTNGGAYNTRSRAAFIKEIVMMDPKVIL